MFQFFKLLLLLVISTSALAKISAPSVFYPLPNQAQGKFVAAKKLFLGKDGGVWIHDVRNKVTFFDGLNLLPRSGSVLSYEYDNVAFLDNAFWSFVDNEIYRTYPDQERELVFSLTPGASIKNIGASKRLIWVSDERAFYTYDVDTGAIETYSLMGLYQFNQTSQIQVNDAQFIFSKWVLATNSGVYLSNDHDFSHVTSSGKHFIETIYFSEKRRELVVGSLSGALIIDIHNPNDASRRFGSSHVLSITENDKEYWVGTEDGLFVYSFLSEQVREYSGKGLSDYDLQSNKIYSLVNDQSGGIWIATDKGVRYFSLFGQAFERVSKNLLTQNPQQEIAKKILKNTEFEGYWLLTNQGLYHTSLSDSPNRSLVYQGHVNDIALGENTLWVATDKGIVCVDAQTYQLIDDSLPLSLKQNAVDFIEVDKQGTVWTVTNNYLRSYDPKTKTLKEFSAQWLISAYLPAKVTTLSSSSQGELLIGTDHGLYRARNGQIRFDKGSIEFGQVIDIKENKRDELWVVSTYGVFKVAPNRRLLNTVPMVDDNIIPHCLVSTDSGMWLTSSAGLSYYNNRSQLVKHFGAPFGVINNEFVSRLCTTDISNLNTLLLGSKYGVLKANTEKLLVSILPESRILFSQISIDQKIVSVGSPTSHSQQIKYGDSISFLFGVMPQVNGQQIEYKLDEIDTWQSLEGARLTLDHLLPGEYTLSVRLASSLALPSDSYKLAFFVLKPWYMEGYTIVSAVVLIIIIVVLGVMWRSRLMIQTNRNLKAQVSLKTDQLRHQSRILLLNNQQLRKQMYVRHILFNDVLSATKKNLRDLSLRYFSQTDTNAQHFTEALVEELDRFRNIKTDNNGMKQVVSLSLVLDSVIRGWKDEFFKSGLGIDFDGDKVGSAFVELDCFNLDVVLNVIFASILKRGYRNQVISIVVRTVEEKVQLSIVDNGECLPEGIQSIDVSSEQEASLSSLQSLVELSGGQVNLFSYDSRNVIELTWRAASASHHDIVAVINDEQEQSLEDPWLNKVKELIEQHYSDPEFSTASASKLLFMSERSLQRRFKQSTEKTFKDYLNTYRLEIACSCLLSGQKVSDVAFECGFNDPSYFSQRFKHHFGMSPTQFIEDQSE